MDIPQAALLPPEALAAVFLHLDTSDVGVVSQVCKKWSNVGTGDEIWRRRVDLRWPGMFSGRVQVNDLLKKAVSDPMVPSRLAQHSASSGVSSPVGTAEHSDLRISWREAYFLLVRVSAAVEVANHTLDALASLPNRKKGPSARRGGRRKAEIDRFINVPRFQIGITSSAIVPLLNWMEDAIDKIDEADAGLDEQNDEEQEAEDDADAQVRRDRGGSPFERLSQLTKEGLHSTYLALVFEVMVQLTRHQNNHVVLPYISHFFETAGPKVGLALTSRYQRPLYEITSLIFRQLSRMVEVLLATRPTPETCRLAAPSFGGKDVPAGITLAEAVFDAITDWAETMPLAIQRSVNKGEGGFNHFFRTCATAIMRKLSDHVWRTKWEQQRRHVQEYFSSPSASSDDADLRELETLEVIIDQLFVKIEDPGPLWQMFKSCMSYLANEASQRYHIPEWQCRASQLDVLHLVTEGCESACLEDMSWVIDTMIEPGLNHSNPTVRMAAATPLAQLADDMQQKIAPFLQRFMALLTNIVLNDQSPEVAEYARECMVNLWSCADGAPTEMLLGFAPALIPNALSVVVERRGEDWSHSLSLLAAAAQALGPEFEPFYGPVVQALLDVISTDASTQSGMVALKRSIEALSIIFSHSSTSNPSFTNDMHIFITDIQRLCSSGSLDLNDQVVVLALVRCAVKAGDQANSIVNLTMPPLLHFMSSAPKIQVNQAGDQNIPSAEDPEWEQVGQDEHIVSINRTDMDRRIIAADALVTYVEKCSGSIWQYWGQLKRLALQLINFVYSNDVMTSASILIPSLLRVLVEKLKSDACSPETVSDTAAEMINTVLTSLDSNVDLTLAASLFESMTEIIDSVVDVQCANKIEFNRIFAQMLETIRNAVDSSSDLRSTAEEDLGDQREEMRFEAATTSHRQCVMSAIELEETIASVSSRHVLDWFLDPHSDWFDDELVSDTVGAQFVLCTTTVLFEHCRQSPLTIVPHLSNLVPLLFDGCQSPSPFVVQPAVYGLGLVAATVHGASFLPFLREAVDNLISVWEYDAARNDPQQRWASVLDNVGSACGRILAEFPPASQDTTEILPVDVRIKFVEIFLSRIPFKFDVSEVESGVECLITLVENHEPAVIAALKQTSSQGPHALAPRVVDLISDKDAIDASLVRRFVKVLSKFISSL